MLYFTLPTISTAVLVRGDTVVLHYAIYLTSSHCREVTEQHRLVYIRFSFLNLSTLDHAPFITSSVNIWYFHGATFWH